MASKKLSVIIPVYNLEKYIEYCVESILPVPKDEVEMVLIDDGSADGSAALCDGLAKRYDSIRVIHQENSGAANTRNAGMRAAAGEYLMFVDGDDFLQPGAVERVLSLPDGKTDIFCFNSFTEYYGENETVSRRHLNETILLDERGEVCEKTFREVSPLPMPWLYVIKKAYIESNEIYMVAGLLDEDEEWTARLFAYSPSVKVVQDGFYMYRRNRENSLTFGRALKNSLADVKIIGLLLQEKRKEAVTARGRSILDNKCLQMVNRVLDDIPNLPKEDAVRAKAALKPYRRLLKKGTLAERIHYYLDGICGRERVKRVIARLVACRGKKG